MSGRVTTSGLGGGGRERSAAGGRATAAAGGFTLAEVIIAITVAGILGAGILALLLGQNRFYGENDDAIYAEQSLRAAADLMAAELRMAGPSDLLAATPESVSVRFDLLRAVICQVTGANSGAVFIYDTVTNANLPASFRGTAYSGPYDSAFVYGDGWVGPSTVSGSTAAKTLCTNNGSPDLPDLSLYRVVTGWTSEFPAVPERGSIVRVYGRLTYRWAPSSLGSGQALWRGAQELVSPFDAGAAFRYVMANGAIQNSVPPAQFDQVRMIRVVATALGDGTNRYDVQREIEYSIPLRN